MTETENTQRNVQTVPGSLDCWSWVWDKGKRTEALRSDGFGLSREALHLRWHGLVHINIPCHLSSLSHSFFLIQRNQQSYRDAGGHTCPDLLTHQGCFHGTLSKNNSHISLWNTYTKSDGYKYTQVLKLVSIFLQPDSLMVYFLLLWYPPPFLWYPSGIHGICLSFLFLMCVTPDW